MKRIIIFLMVIMNVLCGCVNSNNIEAEQGMNIIFLDIDGVVNTQNSINEQIAENKATYSESAQKYLYDFDEKAMGNLKDIIDTSNASIVLTSTWRLDDVLMEELVSQFEKNDIAAEKIIGSTPDLHDEEKDNLRAYEIEHWLDNSEEEINKFVILDDIEDMGKYTKCNLVVSSKFEGLTEELKNKAIKILS